MRPTARDDGRPRGPTRRRLLRWGGLGSLVLLSGCTADVGEEFPPNKKWPTAELTPELPVEEETDVLEEGIEATADAEIADEDAFESTLDDHALEVASVERERDVLTIEYTNAEPYAEGVLHDVGLIAGAFAALLGGGYDAVALDITVLDGAPSSFGAAEIEAAWAREYNDGILTAKEYGELVAATIETKRDSPEVEVTPSE